MSESSRPPGGLVPGYELGLAIGKGGFATVYRGRQVSLDREVAVKIDSRILDDDRNRRRFLREATAAAQVSSHPHVVSLIDAGTTRDNRPYLVMELCDNGSVGQLVKR
ncbi:MAG: protein kinase, partial [Propionibacteriaceae bacterium]|nr:protein kinase [Propionibacteriaceae bacterium]